MKRKGKQKVIKKEEIAESWCFICKDGGYIRLCDRKHCLKCYHPGCVGKDDSFLESESKWTCNWHTCFLCSRSSYFHCYTCTTAVCRRCLPSMEFLQVKGTNGFCNQCLKLALLIEENKGYDSDGDMVDFKDRESCEGLFMEYYVIIKEKEGFDAGDIYAAQGRVKMRKNLKSGSGSEFDLEEEEEQVSEYDDVDYEKEHKRSCKKTRFERQKSVMQRHLKSNKDDFIGWGSRSLIEFLASIGKNTTEELSQHDVTFMVNDYIKENKLFHPDKKKMIICDALLQSLFRRRTINKYRIYDFLEAHFAENQDKSEEVELGYDSENNSASSLDACKRPRKLDMDKKSQKKELEYGVPQSVFASIIVENVKLVYLKRTLLYELLKQPESFEEKVIGTYVRVKSDPYDYCSRNSHQLMQVKGIKKDTVCENNTEIVLQVSAMLKEICIGQLSDDDFSKEECEELRQNAIDGQLERPTVVELEQKARILHKDITKHWINKELALLQKLIDRANEKGWRRELFEYLEKKKRLQTPSEQARLLENVAKVIPDISEFETNSEEIIKDEMTSDEDSPKSILQCNSTIPCDGWQDSKTSGGKTRHSPACHPERKPQIAERSTSSELQRIHSPKHENANESNASSAFTNQKLEDVESKTWCILGPNGEKDKCSLSVLKRWSETSSYASKFKVWKEDESEENAIWLQEVINIAFCKK